MLFTMRCPQDDIKKAGKQQNMAPMWKKLMKNVDIDEPTTFLVYSVYVLYGNTYLPAQLQTPVQSCQLSSFLSCYRSFPSQYPRSYHHQPYPDVS